MKLIFSVISIACMSLGLGGHAFALDPARSIEQYKHTQWLVDDGAPRGINVLAQGASGYLWIGSSEGLFRFDGITFEPIKARAGSETRSVSALTVLSSGEVWVGYAEGGTSVYRDGALEDVPGTEADYVMDFVQSPDGSLWATLGRDTRQLMRYADGRWSDWGSRVNFPAEQPVKMIAARDGSVWVTTMKSLLVLARGSNGFEQLHVTLNGHASLAEDRDGRIWLSDASGSRPVSAGAGSDVVGAAYPTPTPKRKVRTSFDKDGNLWGITTHEGLFRVRNPQATGADDEAAGAAAVRRFTEKEGLLSNGVNFIFEDREGAIWVGMTLGLERFRETTVVAEPSLTKPAFWSDVLLGASDGTVYVGEADAVYRIKPGGRPELLLSATEPQALCEGPDRSIWIVLRDRLTRLKDDTASLVDAPPEAPEQIRDCAVDRQGRIWLAADRLGLLERVDSGWRNILQSTFHGGLATNVVVLDHDERVLVALEDGSLRLIDPDAPTQVLIAANDLLGRILTVYKAGGVVYVGARSGIARLKDGRLDILDARSFSQLRLVGGIVQTRAGQTWMSGPAGITMVDTAALDHAFDAGGGPLSMALFEFRDGYRGVQPRDAIRAVVEGGDGRLWFATTAGTVWIDPAHLPKNGIEPPTAIRAVKAGGVTYRDPRALRLLPGSSNIEIDFAALSLSVPERVKVLYRMVGVDGAWVDPGGRRQAFYTNLAPGRYAFQIIAANDDGVWNRTGSTLMVEIPPTFLQSGWFKAVIALAVVLALWCGYMIRIGQLTARMRVTLETRLAERERIARDLHDTLLQGFQGLILRFQSVANEIPSTQRVRSLIDQALDEADAILEEGRDSVRHLRAIGDIDLGEAFAETAERLRRDYPLQFNVTLEGAPRQLHPVVREELVRIGDEALMNAFRHSGGTSVELAVSYGPSALVLGVRDDGVGIDASILERGGRQGHFGLIGMRERARQIESDFQVSSRLGSGTEIQVVTPGRVAYAHGRRRRWTRLLRPALARSL